MSKYNHTQKPANSGRGWELMCSWDINEPQKQIFRAGFRVELVRKVNGKKIRRDIENYSKEIIKHNQWIHLAGELDMEKNLLNIYVNDKLANSMPIHEDEVLNQNPRNELVIGGYGGSRSNAFTGLIDYVRISNRPFDAVGQIPHYSGKEAGTVLYFDFENTIQARVKPQGTTIECIGMESYLQGLQENSKALCYPQGVLYENKSIKQPTRD